MKPEHVYKSFFSLCSRMDLGTESRKLPRGQSGVFSHLLAPVKCSLTSPVQILYDRQLHLTHVNTKQSKRPPWRLWPSLWAWHTTMFILALWHLFVAMIYQRKSVDMCQCHHCVTQCATCVKTSSDDQKQWDDHEKRHSAGKTAQRQEKKSYYKLHHQMFREKQ